MARIDSGEPIGDNKQIVIDESLAPIDRLKPGSAHHQYVLSYMQKRIDASEKEMQKNYDRWTFSERRHQAFLNLPKYERMLREMNDKGLPPSPAIIVFPYQYAVTSTIVTYLSRVFCGRTPMFSLSANNGETARNLQHMETVLQYQAEHARLVRTFFQLFLDGEMYGLAVTRINWTEEWQNRPTWEKPNPLAQILGSSQKYTRTNRMQKVYQGNAVINIDPFMFFPDPNVPMSQCAEKGEFVFWRDFIGKHIMLRESALGTVKYIENVPDGTTKSQRWYNLSARNLLSGGSSHAGQGNLTDDTKTMMIDQGTVEIIPEELGLGQGSVPEKWLFTIANGTQIIQCEPLNLGHGRHPIAVAEPYTMGYGFSQPALSDYIGPIQDIISWFIDSHIYNVRSALNNMWIVDPSKVEMQDVLSPKPGKVIRLKPTAIGVDVRTVINQLPVQDVTRSHMSDMEAFIRIGDSVSAVNDNLRGLQESGGRKTATEIRVSGDSAGSRLAAHGQLISSQCISEISRQMVLNIQQLQDEDVFVQISGGEWNSVTPMGLTGDFLFPIHDGALPVDKTAMLDVAKEVMGAILQDQELRASYNVPKAFEYVSQDLGGFVNLSNFRKSPEEMQAAPPGQPPGVDLQSPEQIQQGVIQGQLQPIGGIQ